MTTTTRPTPEGIARNGGLREGQIRDDLGKRQRVALLADLAEHGYVIVHPDDVPEFDPNSGRVSDGPNEFIYALGVTSGWSDCRAHIFGVT
jgi:hypothetical protein